MKFIKLALMVLLMGFLVFLVVYFFDKKNDFIFYLLSSTESGYEIDGVSDVCYLSDYKSEIILDLDHDKKTAIGVALHSHFNLIGRSDADKIVVVVKKDHSVKVFNLVYLNFPAEIMGRCFPAKSAVTFFIKNGNFRVGAEK